MDDEMLAMIAHVVSCQRRNCPVRTYLRMRVQMMFMERLLSDPKMLAMLLEQGK